MSSFTALSCHARRRKLNKNISYGYYKFKIRVIINEIALEYIKCKSFVKGYVIVLIMINMNLQPKSY